jgi:hypothetical protein
MWINTWLALSSCTPLHRGLQKKENKKKPAHVKHTHKLKKEEEIT